MPIRQVVGAFQKKGSRNITDSHYVFLGLDMTASREEIVQAVERVSKQANALANVSSEQSRELRDRTRQIKLDLLTSDERRRDYDAMLARPLDPISAFATTGPIAPISRVEPATGRQLDAATVIKEMPTADRVIGVGLAIAFLDLFLPWGPGLTGFYGWGVLFFLVWITMAAFFVQRQFLRDRIVLRPFPWPDWGVELLGSGLMLICVILFLAGIQGSTPGFGWVLGLLVSIAIGLGAVLKGGLITQAPRA